MSGTPEPAGTPAQPPDGATPHRVSPHEPPVLGDRYLLEEPIATGGMATVWRAHDELLARTVAVKILHDHLAADEAFRERFRREAIAAAKLTHPNVVGLFDTGSEGDRVYLVMEYVDGPTLKDVIADLGALEPGQAAAIGEKLARALAAAHERGLVHRDVKPANVLIGEDGTVKIADFGIAKAEEAGGGDLTTPGMVLGTAAYVAPEQVRGRPVDGQADQYALGCVLYEALTGRQPFRADTPVATAALRLEQPPLPPRSLRAGIPRGLDEVVLTAMAVEPEERHPSLAHLADALAPYAEIDAAGALLVPLPRSDPGRAGWHGISPDAHTLTGQGPAGGRAAPGGVGAGGGGTAPGGGRAARAGRTPARQGSASSGAAASAGAGSAGAGSHSGTATLPTQDQTLPPSALPYGGSDPRDTFLRTEGRWLGPILGLLVAVTLLVGLGLATGVLEPGDGFPIRLAREDREPQLVAPVAINAFDPQGDGSENDRDLPAILDGDNATAWRTDLYRGSPRFGNLKDGAGFWVDLGASRTLHSVALRTTTPGISYEVRVADSPAPGVEGWRLVGQAQDAAELQEVRFAEPVVARYLLVWITGLQPQRGRFAAGFSAMAVRGAAA